MARISNKELYNRELLRIERGLKRLERQGVDISQIELPTISGRVTKEDIAKIKKITSTNLVEQQFGFNPRTGETNQIRLATEEDYDYYTSFDEQTIRVFKQQLEKFPNSRAGEVIDVWLNTIIAKNGVHNTARMLEEGLYNGLVITYEEAYDYSKLVQYLSDMLNYLEDQDIGYKEDIEQFMQLIEQDFEDWSEPQ